MAWAAIVATAVSAYASSREQDERREDERRMTREEREERRQRVVEGYNSWGDYGMGGSREGMWNQPAPNYQGILAPSNFRSQYGTGAVPMPWGQPQQNFRGRG